ncbi:hypothetical protein JTB14_026197 [Gonioctena quinquepunctata]|nr:hypothetical protein JTB14_026197 [Gonioctena quinquepunctata]
MYRYGISDPGQLAEKNISHFLKKYPELITSLGCYTTSKLKCEGRVLRRDTERIKKIKRFRKQPNLRLRQFENKCTAEAKKSNSYTNRCTVCAIDLVSPGRHINVLLQELVEKWRDRNRNNPESGIKVPETVDILGVEPRYNLRSGYAGLQIKSEIENEISHFIYESAEDQIRYTDKRMSNNSNICNSSFKDIWLDGNIDTYKHFQETLKNVFREVDDIKEGALKTSWNCITPSDLECILCSRCLLDPVTTGCGHTFCRSCLARVLDHGLSCPLCMTPLNILEYSRGCTEVLQQAIRFLVPEDFNERVSVSIKESLIMETSSDIPVFICTNAFPGVACPLYVYEPRYRLLARRSLQSSTKRFAMAGKDSYGDKFVQYGTILEVKDAVNLEDGRFILTTVGFRRFKVISRGEQDGYDTAKINFIKDSDVPEEKLQELFTLHEKVYYKASKWIRSLKPKILAEVERLIGKMPRVEINWSSLPDGPSWAWWLMPILPLSSQLQVGFLSTTSLEKRLRAIDKMLEHMKIRMKALERNNVSCSHEIDPLDSCGETERSFDMPYNNN